MYKKEILTEQSLYNVILTDLIDFVNTYILEYVEPKPNHSMDNMFNVQVLKNNINLKNEPFIVNDNVIIDIKNFLNYKFFKIVKEISNKNRLENNKEFDILPEDNFYYKLQSSIIHIGNSGRIGNAQYLLINNKTFQKYENELNKFDLKKIIDENLDDDEMILGRKNEFSNPGIFLILNENSLEQISYNDKNDKIINLIYNFSTEGEYCYKQYLLVKIKK